MTYHLDGIQLSFRSGADKERLVGLEIDYLRESDIDNSGRGLLFVQSGTVNAVQGRSLILEDGRILDYGELVEIVSRQ